MSILNYMSVTSTATAPIPRGSPSPPLPAAPSQVPTQNRSRSLPKKSPLKLDAPTDCEATQTTSELRSYWGGEEEDPLTSDDFIWNKDFVARFKRMIRDPHSASSESPSPVEKESSGFLSLNRVLSLDSLEVDLSKQLSPISRTEPDRLDVPPSKSSGSASPQWKLAPTRREQEKWERASKAATGGTVVMFREVRRPQGNPKVLAAQSKEEYLKLKRKLQLLTLSVGGIGLISSYISYSPETAASFGIGFLASLMYIRMLGSSVDSMADGAKGLIKGSIGQPRLLVPVALIMIFNRWNEILVPDFGYVHLDLIPMLVGFFTYKIATFIQAIDDTISAAGQKTQI